MSESRPAHLLRCQTCEKHPEVSVAKGHLSPLLEVIFRAAHEGHEVVEELPSVPEPLR